jgi:hypothetical protein
MKMLSAAVLIAAVCFSVALASAQDTGLEEKIRDVSPDKKFAIRIKFDPAVDDGSGDSISSDAIRSIDVIALPGKTLVTNLATGEGSIEGKIVWSQDSKWFAYAVGEGHRVTETSAYHWKGDKFEPLTTEEMSVDPGGDARNQYITPIRWTKSGTLAVNQFTIFTKGSGDSTIEFTVRFDENGKFHVVSKKKVRTKQE